MSVVVTEFMALVLILGVFEISCILSCAHSGSYSAEKEVKWEMSWLVKDTFFPPTPTPNTHIHSHTHTLMLIWFEKISGNIIINFSSCKTDYSCDCPLLEFLKIYTLPLLPGTRCRPDAIKYNVHNLFRAYYV